MNDDIHNNTIFQFNSYNIKNINKIHFFDDDLQIVNEKTVFDMLYAEMENQFYNELIIIIDDFKSFDNNINEKSFIVEYICEYLGSKKCIFKEEFKINYSSILKRYLILDKLSNLSSNLMIKKNIEDLLKNIYIDDFCFLYPNKNGECLFDLVCSFKSTIDLFIDKYSKIKFTEFMFKNNKYLVNLSTDILFFKYYLIKELCTNNNLINSEIFNYIIFNIDENYHFDNNILSTYNKNYFSSIFYNISIYFDQQIVSTENDIPLTENITLIFINNFINLFKNYNELILVILNNTYNNDCFSKNFFYKSYLLYCLNKKNFNIDDYLEFLNYKCTNDEFHMLVENINNKSNIKNYIYDIIHKLIYNKKCINFTNNYKLDYISKLWNMSDNKNHLNIHFFCSLYENNNNIILVDDNYFNIIEIFKNINLLHFYTNKLLTNNDAFGFNIIKKNIKYIIDISNDFLKNRIYFDFNFFYFYINIGIILLKTHSNYEELSLYFSNKLFKFSLYSFLALLKKEFLNKNYSKEILNNLKIIYNFSINNFNNISNYDNYILHIIYNIIIFSDDINNLKIVEINNFFSKLYNFNIAIYNSNYYDINDGYQNLYYEQILIPEYKFLLLNNNNIIENINFFNNEELKIYIKENINEIIILKSKSYENTIFKEDENKFDSSLIEFNIIKNLIGNNIILEDDIKNLYDYYNTLNLSNCTNNNYDIYLINDYCYSVFFFINTNYQINYSLIFKNLILNFIDNNLIFNYTIIYLTFLLSVDQIMSVFYENKISNNKFNELEIKYFRILFNYNISNNYSKIINLYYCFLNNYPKIENIDSQLGFLGQIVYLNKEIVNNIFNENFLEIQKIYNIINLIINDSYKIDIVHYDNLFLNDNFIYYFKKFLHFKINDSSLYNKIFKFIDNDPNFFDNEQIISEEYWNLENNNITNLNKFFNINNIFNRLIYFSKLITKNDFEFDFNSISDKISKIYLKFINDLQIIDYLKVIIKHYKAENILLFDDSFLNKILQYQDHFNYFFNIISKNDIIYILKNTLNLELFIKNQSAFLYKFLLDSETFIGLKLNINLNYVKDSLNSINKDDLFKLYENNYFDCNLYELIKINPDLINVKNITLDNDIKNYVLSLNNFQLTVNFLNIILKNNNIFNIDDILVILYNKDIFNISNIIEKISDNDKINFSKYESFYSKILESSKYDILMYEILILNKYTDKKYLCNLKNNSDNLIISYFKDNKNILENTILFINFNSLFEKNRMGEYIIENLLSDNNTYLFKKRSDYDQITQKINELNISINNSNNFDKLIDTGKKNSSNYFMYYCITKNSDYIDELLSILTDEQIKILSNTLDDILENVTFYIAKYHSGLFEKYIDKLDPESFYNVNAFNETLAMFCMKYNLESYNILEKTDYIYKRQNYVNMDSGSLISYCAKYNSSKFLDIIESKYFDIYSLYVKDNTNVIDFSDLNLKKVKTYVNFTNILIINENYNALLKIKELYSDIMNRHLNELFYINDEEFYSLKYALLIDPEISNLIIGSNLCDDKLIQNMVSTFPDNDISCISTIQPYSWYILNNSSKFKNYILPIENEYHYNKKVSISYIINNYPNLHKLVKNKQIYDTTDKNICKICNLAKSTILNTNCSHKFCISCMIIETKCPICNVEYNIENLYYID